MRKAKFWNRADFDSAMDHFVAFHLFLFFLSRRVLVKATRKKLAWKLILKIKDKSEGNTNALGLLAIKGQIKESSCFIY